MTVVELGFLTGLILKNFPTCKVWHLAGLLDIGQTFCRVENMYTRMIDRLVSSKPVKWYY